LKITLRGHREDVVAKQARRSAVLSPAAVSTGGLLALVAATRTGLPGWIAALAYAAAGWTALTVALRRAGARSLGPADYVTLTRATLVGSVTAMVTDTFWEPPPLALLVTIASVALALDAVDGMVARRTGTASPLGARFDMEVDAFLILVLSVLVATTLGAWVLTIGVMRYAYVAASWALKWLKAPLPPSMARKTVAAIQGVALVVAGSEIFPPAFSVSAAALALAALTWSFSRDIWWLYRHQAP
jgi:phosphatidylglycerophosphate synthase